MKLLSLSTFLFALTTCHPIDDGTNSIETVKRYSPNRSPLAPLLDIKKTPYIVRLNNNVDDAGKSELTDLIKSLARPGSPYKQSENAWHFYFSQNTDIQSALEEIRSFKGLVQSAKQLEFSDILSESESLKSRSTEMEWMVFPKDPKNEDEIAKTREWLESKVSDKSKLQEYKQNSEGDIFWSGISFSDDALNEAREYKGISKVAEDLPMKLFTALSAMEAEMTDPNNVEQEGEKEGEQEVKTKFAPAIARLFLGRGQFKTMDTVRSVVTDFFGSIFG